MLLTNDVPWQDVLGDLTPLIGWQQPVAALQVSSSVMSTLFCIWCSDCHLMALHCTETQVVCNRGTAQGIADGVLLMQVTHVSRMLATAAELQQD